MKTSLVIPRQVAKKSLSHWRGSFLYQAASWTMARRVVGKVEFHFGELFPRVGFIVTNLTAKSRRWWLLQQAWHGGTMDQRE